MIQNTHSIAQYIQACAKAKQAISPLLPISLHSIETIPYNGKNKNFHLLSELIKNVDIKKWKHLIDENIFNDEVLLKKALYESFTNNDITFFQECVFYAIKIIDSFNEQTKTVFGSPEKEQTLIQKQNVTALLVKIASNYPVSLSRTNVNKISEDFLDKFMDLKTIATCILGTEFNFNFKYSQSPINIKSVISDKNNWISNVKEQILTLTGENINSFSFTHPVFQNYFGSTIDAATIFKIICIENSKTDNIRNNNKEQLIDILKYSIDKYVENNKMNYEHFKTIFQNFIQLEDFELLKHTFNLRKNTPNNLANLYNESIINLFENNDNSNYQSIQAIFTTGNTYRFKIVPSQLNITLDLLSQEKLLNNINLKNPEFFLFSKKFQNKCEDPIFLEQYNLSVIQNNKTSFSSQDLIKYVLLIQLVKEYYPNIQIKVTKNFEDFIDNFCDLTTSSFLPLRQNIINTISKENAYKFLNTITSKKIEIEKIEEMLIESCTQKNTNSSKPLKF